MVEVAAPPEQDSMVRLLKENAELRLAVQARDDFIAVATHELRNPMTPLVGQVNLLRRRSQLAGTAMPPQIAKDIERLDLTVRRYIKRTTAILDISRLTGRKFHLHPGLIDVSAIVHHVTSDFVSIAAAAGSTLTVETEPKLIGLFDRTALEEIVENLLSNAVKYGDGKSIHVSLTHQDDAVCLQVQDHGIGISLPDQARIFGQFERLITDTPTSGFGLGLWVVGQLVKVMGGTIAVDSQPSIGSTFIVRLPLHTTAGYQ